MRTFEMSLASFETIRTYLNGTIDNQFKKGWHRIKQHKRNLCLRNPEIDEIFQRHLLQFAQLYSRSQNFFLARLTKVRRDVSLEFLKQQRSSFLSLKKQPM